MPDPTLRARLVAALREAAHDCPGDCGMEEAECRAQHPIQVSALHFGEVGSVYGEVNAIADTVLAAVADQLSWWRKARTDDLDLIAALSDERDRYRDTVERVRQALCNQSYLTSLDDTIAEALDPKEA